MKIAVGGMISSGKSTLVKQLGNDLDIPAISEFRKNDEVFNTLLQWLYEGKKNIELLLQNWFLHKHWQLQIKYNDGDIIVDRDLIEHWLFAQTNLSKHKEQLVMYNGLFHMYMSQINSPDLYIILDINWETFEKRIKQRGRKQEVDNFDKNKTYFKLLLKNYTKRLKSQCSVYDIPYAIINTNDLSQKETLEMAKVIIENHGLGEYNE